MSISIRSGWLICSTTRSSSMSIWLPMVMSSVYASQSHATPTSPSSTSLRLYSASDDLDSYSTDRERALDPLSDRNIFLFHFSCDSNRCSTATPQPVRPHLPSCSISVSCTPDSCFSLSSSSLPRKSPIPSCTSATRTGGEEREKGSTAPTAAVQEEEVEHGADVTVPVTEEAVKVGEDVVQDELR